MEISVLSLHDIKIKQTFFIFQTEYNIQMTSGWYDDEIEEDESCDEDKKKKTRSMIELTTDDEEDTRSQKYIKIVQ